LRIHHALRQREWTPPLKEQDVLFERDLHPAGKPVRNTRKKRKLRAG